MLFKFSASTLEMSTSWQRVVDKGLQVFSLVDWRINKTRCPTPSFFVNNLTKVFQMNRPRFVYIYLVCARVFICCHSCVAVRGQLCDAVHVQRSKDKLNKLAVSFYHVGSREPTQVIRLGRKCPHPESCCLTEKMNKDFPLKEHSPDNQTTDAYQADVNMWTRVKSSSAVEWCPFEIQM